ncbi:MAG TPA: DUF4097 family beta strand repeat-containing protein [Terriglobia bacterium]|nr:DUF4097 family beta strand repeat-containing protein [Terriglobia bacterium]
MKFQTVIGVAGVIAGLVLPSYAKCPVNETTVLVIKAETGDIQVDTTGREALVDVQADGGQIHEACGKQTIEYTGSGARLWKVSTPKDIDLNLSTVGGTITVMDVDGNVVAHTSGGSVTVGNIRGNASITTQGGSIKTGNIGGSAQMHTPGTIEVGDIGGNADLHTTAGRITTGIIAGMVADAEAGRTISISKAMEVQANTTSGDISIGEAARIKAKSGGGHITSRKVHGPAQLRTEQGDIRLDSAGSWVEASTGQGNILVHMSPENYESDLHMNLEAGVGDVTVYVPSRLRASIDATVQRPAVQSPGIFSEFPAAPNRPPQGLIPTNKYYGPSHSESFVNGGGNKIVLHTSLGKITIRKN